jgi:predicted Zn-dependent protease
MGQMGYGSQQAPRRRGGLPIRLLIAVAIAGFAAWQYYSRVEVNPVTGETQRIALTAEQEVALGLEAAPEMARQMGGVVDPDEPAARFVKEVGAKVVAGSIAAQSPYPFEFHLLADGETVNAFALPGGQVFLTAGLLMRLEDEAEVAAVLGHEVGHVIHRHGAEHMAKGQLGQLLTMAVGVAGSDGDSGGQRAAMIASMVNQVVQLKYGRSDELESDRFGLDALSQVGFDPTAMRDLMGVLAEASQGGRPPEMLSSHPYPENRIEQIEQYLGTSYPSGIPPELSRGRGLSVR